MEHLILEYTRTNNVFVFAEDGASPTPVAHFAGQVHQRCQVWLKVTGVTNQRTSVAIVTELPHEASVTNDAEYIASALVQGRVGNPGRLVCVEYYPPVPEIRDEETFDLVTFDWEQTQEGWRASNPDWQSVSREWVETLLREVAPVGALIEVAKEERGE